MRLLDYENRLYEKCNADRQSACLSDARSAHESRARKAKRDVCCTLGR